MTEADHRQLIGGDVRERERRPEELALVGRCHSRASLVL